MPIPNNPAIYHIVNVDRLASIAADGFIWSDAEVQNRALPGTTIGMSKIKERRLQQPLSSHHGLHVGQCTPFYFCPRSVMLYLIHRGSDELDYKGGQQPIVHLVADLHETVAWAQANGRRWAFTSSNAGSFYFNDWCDLTQLDQVPWDAVANNGWGYNGVSRSIKEGKQSEFLVEQCFPWHLVRRIGVINQTAAQQVGSALFHAAHKPTLEVQRGWYY